MSDRHADRRREQQEHWQAGARPGPTPAAGNGAGADLAARAGPDVGNGAGAGNGSSGGGGGVPPPGSIRWDPSLPTPAAVRPISLTGPTWRDRMDTYRSWPRWARIAAPTAAVVVVLGVGALGMTAGRGSEGDSLTTYGEGVGGPVGIDATDGDEAGGNVPASSADPGPTSPVPTTAASPTSSAPPDAGSGTATPTSSPDDNDSTGGDPDHDGPDAPPPDGQDRHDDPHGGPDATTTTTGNQCHPSYSGCVPVADDVDCEGRGDGPVYVGGHQDVIGPDVYDLDPDHNGRTCD